MVFKPPVMYLDEIHSFQLSIHNFKSEQFLKDEKKIKKLITFFFDYLKNKNKNVKGKYYLMS